MHDFDQYFAIRRYVDLSIRPGGDEVVYSTDTTGQFNLWRQDAEGGWPYQLTWFSDRAVRRVAWSPDGDRIAFAADRGGDENEQIYVLPEAGGQPRRLTEGDDVRYLLAARPWAPDGRTLAAACNLEDRANYDLVTIDADTGRVRRYSTEPLAHAAVCWSPDGRLLCGVISHGNTHQDVVVADRETGECRGVTRARHEAMRTPVGFSSDGGALYLLTDEGRNYRGLARLDLESGKLDWLKSPEWDIDDAVMSRDGRWLLYVLNEDAVHRVRVLDRNSGIDTSLPQMQPGRVLGIDVADRGSRAGVIHTTSRRPAEIVTVNLTRRAETTITHGMIGGVPTDDMVSAEVIRYPTFDRKIPALLYRPTGPAPAQGFPALLWIHGGPEAQEQPGYRPLFQYLASRGIAVLAPNIRGSTGYGRSYQKLILRDQGGDDLRDFEAAARFLKDHREIDGKRLAVAGGSYGGFAALSCATRLPDYWTACINICGPANLVSFARNVPPAWKRFMRDWVGDPDEEAEDLLRRSPVTYLDALRCPLLVVQGAHDPRVRKDESDDVVNRVRERGGDVEYLVFEDEGHDFLKRKNRLKMARAVAGFVLQHLGAMPCVTP